MGRIRIAFVLSVTLAAGLAAAQPAQPLAERYTDIGTMIVTTSAFTMFPHEKRVQGHNYEGKSYPADVHYSDRTVAIFVPKGFRVGDATDLVFYLHGWRNNVDDTFTRFRVAEQLAASGVNAVLVLAEGPKNAPDSFGGKLEETGVFASLVSDVLSTLKARGVIANTKPGSIVLAGHSGAYRVMAFILTRGGLTDDLRAWDIPFAAVPESAVTQDLLRKNRLVFIDSALEHNDVVAKNDQFRAFLTASAVSRR